MANLNNCATWCKFLTEQPAEIADVANSVIKQLGGTTPEALEELHAVYSSSCGAAGGYTGFIWYSDTVAFWRKNRNKIVAMMNHTAESFGDTNILGMVQNFRSLSKYTADEIARALYGRFNEDLTEIYNTFAWYALEEVGYYYGEYLYNLENC
jgi:hypothetical protein